MPLHPRQTLLDWDLPDPKGLPLNEVRLIRDEIAYRVAQLVADLDALPDKQTAWRKPWPLVLAADESHKSVRAAGSRDRSARLRVNPASDARQQE
jgi:hypothetical protein